MQEHHFKVRVYSEDTDCWGIVHHANFIKYMERARLDWLLEQGFRLDSWVEQGYLFVIKKIAIDYVTPAKLYDDLDVQTRIKSYRKVAKVYEHIIRDAGDVNKIYCQANIHVVCVDKKLRPQAMPQQLQEKMNDL
jgi:acyl-CoA thioester hydrolase